MKQPATFISIWDGGTTIRSKCMIDLKNERVTDIEIVDIDGLDNLDEEYVELDGGEKIDITDFEVE